LSHLIFITSRFVRLYSNNDEFQQVEVETHGAMKWHDRFVFGGPGP